MLSFSQINIDEEKIRALCQRHNIKLLILHGSYAKGKATSQSDIDIGILCNESIKDFKKYSAIINDFCGVFGDKFDPVFLNGVEPLISYHTVMHGLVLYQANKHDYANYKIQTIGRYLDTKKSRELEKEYVKRAIRS
ncbi:MAG: nucleotidyltransferase domain-containing protein [Candidatus Margulisbacteria bacterium]|nr:nucleotidyltransferase domain-containing protein [Candidatus Margulisiibacteriota bacterium]